MPQDTAGRVGRLALVNMPFTSAERPSIQCGLLKAVMRRAGHTVDVHYLSLELAAAIGADVYAKICDIRADQFVGDWLFTVAAFGHRPTRSITARRAPISTTLWRTWG